MKGKPTLLLRRAGTRVCLLVAVSGLALPVRAAAPNANSSVPARQFAEPAVKGPAGADRAKKRSKRVPAPPAPAPVAVPMPPAIPPPVPVSEQHEDTGPWLLVLFVVGGGLAIPVYVLGIARPARRRAEEAAAAPPLAAVGAATTHFAAEMTDLIAEFDRLKTFTDVERWDSRASLLAGQLEDACRNLVPRINIAQTTVRDYRAAPKDPPHVAQARVAKTTPMIDAALKWVDSATTAFEELMERIDMTPNNAREQRELLRAVREEKKDLQSRKKEARAEMTEIKRQARVATVEAQASPWAGTYGRRVAAGERRAIRNKKEAALHPHETEVAAIERQLIAKDRHIAWLQRFGDDEDA